MMQQKERLKTDRLDDVMAALDPFQEPETTPSEQAPVRTGYRYLANRRDQLKIIGQQYRLAYPLVPARWKVLIVTSFRSDSSFPVLGGRQITLRPCSICALFAPIAAGSAIGIHFKHKFFRGQHFRLYPQVQIGFTGLLGFPLEAVKRMNDIGKFDDVDNSRCVHDASLRADGLGFIKANSGGDTGDDIWAGEN